MFIDKLIEKITEKKNPTVVGLDPRMEYIPSSIKGKAFKESGVNLQGAARAIIDFNKKIIDAIYDIVPAVKPQLAYYEMYGIPGLEVFEQTVRYAHSKGLLVIGDGKRNDIGTTAEAYSKAYLGEVELDGKVEVSPYNVDALTVNPYLGYDGVKPFIQACKKYDKGIFVLVKTSNKSSGQLQDLLTQQGKSVYEIMAEYVEEWGKDLIGKHGYSSIGAVVGATYPNQAKILRRIMKRAYILVPGYGAQGGTARDVAHCFNNGLLGAVVNASRSIIYAYRSDVWKDKFDEDSFDHASRQEAIKMRDEIIQAIDN